MISLTPRHGAPALLATAAVATLLGAPPAAAAPAPQVTWRAQVVPAAAVVSRPRFLLDVGQVVGVDAPNEYSTGRPWRWSPLLGRRDLDLDAGTTADVADVGSVVNVVGTVYGTDASGTFDSTAVRWVARRPAPLLPDAEGTSWAQATNRRGEAVVQVDSPTTGSATYLVAPGVEPELLPLLSQFQSVRSMNDARDLVVISRGPGTIGPASFSVLRDGTSYDLGLPGVRDFPSCTTAITESGNVAGSHYVFGTFVRESVLWRDGVRTPLPAGDGLEAIASCAENGVNEAGNVVGTVGPPRPLPGEPLPTEPTRAVVWQGDVVRELARDTATRTVRPVALNERDVVVATVDDPTGAAEPGPALFYPNGRRVDLAVPAGLSDVRAVDVNELDQVVGTARRTAADGAVTTVTVVWTPAPA